MLWLILIIATVFLDQITKWLAVIFLRGADTVPVIKDVIHLTYLENTGAAFGILKDHRWVFLVLTTVTIIGLSVYLFKFAENNKILKTSVSFIIGGGIGNMIDRLVSGYVVDFIDFRLINFAIFNIADSFVCIGAALMVLYLFSSSDKSKEKKNETVGKGAEGKSEE